MRTHSPLLLSLLSTSLGLTAACGPSGRNQDDGDNLDSDDSSSCTPGELTCNGNDVVRCDADGTAGDFVESCASPTVCSGGACILDDGCSDEAQLIYVVDTSNRLLSFDPTKLANGQDPFTPLGTLSCPASGALDGSGTATPFSMAVDRNAVAWILYNSGEVFNVPVDTSSCTDSGYTPLQNGLDLFGMGFVTDTAGGDTEQLYIAGADLDGFNPTQLGRIDPQTLGLTVLGQMRSDTENSAELTGTGDAELFAFYPGLDRAFVQQVDPASGAGVGPEFDFAGGLGTGGGFEAVTAWAFAQWGGKFFLFVTVSDQFEGSSNSSVRIIDPETGASSTALQNLPYIIVGAGVSTCAPTVID